MNKLANVYQNYVRGFAEGDFKTRLSYFVMGAGSFLRKQYLRGFSFLFLQIVFIAYMATDGIQRIAGLATLGTIEQGQYFDENLGIYIYSQGDNSMLFLLFGVVAIGIIIGMIFLYYVNVRSAYQNQKMLEEGKKLNSFREDIRELMDGKFHVTVLIFPVILTLIFTILPLVFMILIAFTNFDQNHQPPGNLFTWVGLRNFADMLYNNSFISGTFFSLLQWTFVWAFFATFLNYILGMLLAMLINKKGIRLKKMWRTIFMITIAIPQFVSLMLMSQLLSDTGALNSLLQNLGIIAPTAKIGFLSDGNLARITVIVVNCWVGIPHTMLITSGILMNIPRDMYESADIDGASASVKFFKITLPYMLNVTAPYLLTQFVGNLNNFNVIYLLTGGGPLTLKYHQAGETDLLVTWLYKITVNEKNYALASTLGIVIFLISAILSLVVFNRIMKREGAFQ